jgi:hypothetical protein
MRNVYRSLGEKGRRRYAAVEAAKLGHGGVSYVSRLLGCSQHTIRRGLDELDDLDEDDPAAGRQRRPGGGRKARTEEEPRVEDHLFSILEYRTAGDPDDPDVLWTDLSPADISERLDLLGTPVSRPTVEQWLAGQHVTRRKIQKTIPGGVSPDRDRQFRQIAELRAEFAAAGNPVFSVDTKAKEHLGFLWRAGRVRTAEPFRAFDHDYPNWAEGVVVPHGVHDPLRNHGHLNLGLSHDTSEFACDSFYWFWRRSGRFHYRRATEILWLCDAGGSHNCRHHVFKQDLGRLASRVGLPIRVAHYPTHCSKFNPIERRFFAQVGRTCRGVLFDSLQTAVDQMRKTRTATGLTTTVHVMRRLYERGRKATRDFLDNMNVTFHSVLPRWNYTAQPAPTQ